MEYFVVPNSTWVLVLMPSWSRCLPVSGVVSGWMPGASAKPEFISEGVLGNQVYLGCSLPVSVPSGPVTGWACSPCRAALMLMRFCGLAPVLSCVWASLWCA